MPNRMICACLAMTGGADQHLDLCIGCGAYGDASDAEWRDPCRCGSLTIAGYGTLEYGDAQIWCGV